MFEALTQRLEAIFDRLRGAGRLSEENIHEALREVRVALLEADVNFRVAKSFVERVREQAVGQEVLRSLTPGQQVIKVVHAELVLLLGEATHRLSMAPRPPTVMMVLGLQGSGKTTTVAKLGRHYQREGFRPLLVAADVYRPAAIEQLRVLGRELGLPVHGAEGQQPVVLCREALELAAGQGLNPVLLDTAGRLHIDEGMVEELRVLRREVKPHHALLVVDAMTGQDAVTMAARFNAEVGYDGVILTKLDGDARGGAALSIRSVTGKPIVFCGVGERVDALEPFHPERMASRILGMGDVLSLVEKAQATVDAAKAEDLARKIREDSFTLEDFADQLRQLQKMGPLGELMDMVPFFKGVKLEAGEIDAESRQLRKFEAIINSMTPEERRAPAIVNGDRRTRIARGSGTTVQDVNRLLKQFAQMRKMMKGLKGMHGRAGLKQLRRALPFLES
ncbi:MAG TPA: signal recognition particle protein [Methylomirabilota bacterium]|jgi:signal recognition particle subunit SRP54|nr:signal recognition particle protein [Methylomirabilota bacterium]